MGGSTAPNAPSALRFAEALALALRRAGSPAHRVEAAMEAFSARTAIGARFYVLPTSILAAVPGGTRLLPIEPGAPSLRRLTLLDTLASEVAAQARTPEDGLAAIAAMEASPPRWGPGITAAAFAGAAIAVAPLVGGGLREAVAAGAVALAVGAASTPLGRDPRSRRMVELLAAAVGTVVLHLVGLAMGGLDSGPALLAGLIVLLPGFTLTVGMTELATGHRISGTTNLVAAAMTLLQLGVGVAVGSRIATAALGPVPVVPAVPLGAAVQLAGLPLIAASFAVLLDAHKRHVPHVLAACAAAMAGASLGAVLLGPALGGLLGALAVAALANAAARRWNQPASILLVPGILLLVPGSIGFRAVRALIEQDAVAGVEGGFAMLLASAALVAGSLAGNAIVRPRGAL